MRTDRRRWSPGTTTTLVVLMYVLALADGAAIIGKSGDSLSPPDGDPGHPFAAPNTDNNPRVHKSDFGDILRAAILDKAGDSLSSPDGDPGRRFAAPNTDNPSDFDVVLRAAIIGNMEDSLSPKDGGSLNPFHGWRTVDLQGYPYLKLEEAQELADLNNYGNIVDYTLPSINTHYNPIENDKLNYWNPPEQSFKTETDDRYDRSSRRQTKGMFKLIVLVVALVAAACGYCKKLCCGSSEEPAEETVADPDPAERRFVLVTYLPQRADAPSK